MKTNTISHRILKMLFSITLGLTFSAAQAELLLHYRFDNSDNTATTVADLSGKGNTGTYWNSGKQGSPTTGVSGEDWDAAFDNTAATMGGANNQSSGGIRNTTVIPTEVASIKSFTISLWYNTGSASVSIGSGARLFNIGNETTRDGFLYYNGNTLVFNQNGADKLVAGTEAQSIIQSKGEWVFVAITYDADAETNKLQLYVGNSSTEASVVATSNDTLNLTPVGGIQFGHKIGYHPRGFSGYLDEIRFYGSMANESGALDVDGIRAVQQAAFSQIPEVSSWALLLGVATLACVSIARFKFCPGKRQC